MDREKLIKEVEGGIIQISTKISMIADTNLEHYHKLTTVAKLSPYGHNVLKTVLTGLKLIESLTQDLKEVKNLDYLSFDYEKNTNH